jgi:hypothetical protein
MYAHKEQYFSACERNVANDFSLVWSKPFSLGCVGDIPRQRKVWIYRHPDFNASVSGEQSVVVC